MNTIKLKTSYGFSILEGLVYLGLVVLIVSMVVPAAKNMVEKSRSRNVLLELEQITVRVDQFYREKSSYPDTLAEIYGEEQLDPWGTPYQYLKILGEGNRNRGQRRKSNGREINSDYDLYSMGPDEKSTPPLNSNVSHDDFIRGRNGRFIGSVPDYR